MPTNFKAITESINSYNLAINSFKKPANDHSYIYKDHS